MESVIQSFTSTLSPELKEVFSPLLADALTGDEIPPTVTFDDIKGSLPYEPDTKIFKTSTHIGQRKLFLTELQFITDEIPAGKPATIVYAGAAPSNHTGYLSSLFPHIKFILVDPNPFDIVEARPTILQPSNGPEMTPERADALVRAAVQGRDKLYIINDLFTLDLSRAVAKYIPDSYFISDIRTNLTDRGMPDTLDILWNLSQQFNWMYIMKPTRSMLKFRHPFYTEDSDVFLQKCTQMPFAADFKLSYINGIDFISNFKKKELIYWDGKVNLQAWCGQSSTESRLITSATHIKNWGTPTEYEDKYYYYNSIERCYRLHENNNVSRELGFDHCNDCALENRLWCDYLQKYPRAGSERNNVHAFVRKLSHITHRHLSRGDHGAFFGKYDPQLLTKASELHKRTPHGAPINSIINPRPQKRSANPRSRK